MRTDESRHEVEKQAEDREKERSEHNTFSLNPAQMSSIGERFVRQRSSAAAREKELFGVFAGPLTEQERLALEFLYAYMPINDLADYDGELFLMHVRQALRMRAEMPWGDSVPDELFLNYVLPPRINNERIEDYRDVIAGELRDRVQGLSMQDAVLETNYWCYEKATYSGSDARTISPLGLIRSAKGRCGEESTLATAALRSIGIPARQCYTPRWAHVDDNHAWVEAWADGQWHFIGACEPEPALDRGWFDGPARRAMLVHTRVPAEYAGPEPVTHSDDVHTEINLLANYAPVRTLEIRVTDEAGRPAAGAEVQFQLYNYAELYPLASMRTNEEGAILFVTGFGDLVVRASQSGVWGETVVYGSRSVNPADEAQSSEPYEYTERVELILSQSGQPSGSQDFDLTPPPERAGAASEPLSEQQLELHRRKMAEGERIRAAFEASFADEAQSAELADRLGLDAVRVFKVLGDARGNAGEIAALLAERTPQHGEWPLRLLESLTAKDLIDTDRKTLDDHLLHGIEILQEFYRTLDGKTPTAQQNRSGDNAKRRTDAEAEITEVFVPYVLCPRVRWEKLAPYRRQLREMFTAQEVSAFRGDPRLLAGQVTSGWRAVSDRTPVPGKASPAGTFALRSGDRESVEILLVAFCRSLGIPARLHPETQRPQALEGGIWIDLERPAQAEDAADHKKDTAVARTVPSRGTLRMVRSESSAAASNMGAAEFVEASYHENFTLARLEHGFYTTLNYPFRRQDVYDLPFELETGKYRMTTGIRLQDGRVLGRMFYFTVEPDRETVLKPTFRQPEETVPVLAAAEGRSRLLLPGSEEGTLAGLAGSAGALVAWIDYRLEPTRHLLREAGELKETLEAAGVPLVFIIHSELARRSFVPVPPEQGVEASQVSTSAPGLRSEAFSDSVPAEIRPFVPTLLPSGARFAYDLSGEAFEAMNANCPPPGTEYPHLFVLDADLNVRYAESGYKPGSCSEALNILRAVRG